MLKTLTCFTVLLPYILQWQIRWRYHLSSFTLHWCIYIRLFVLLSIRPYYSIFNFLNLLSRKLNYYKDHISFSFTSFCKKIVTELSTRLTAILSVLHVHNTLRDFIQSVLVKFVWKFNLIFHWKINYSFPGYLMILAASIAVDALEVNNKILIWQQ